MFKSSNILTHYLAKTLVGPGVPPLLERANENDYEERSENEENDHNDHHSHVDLVQYLQAYQEREHSKSKETSSSNDAIDASNTISNKECDHPHHKVSLLEQLDVCSSTSPSATLTRKPSHSLCPSSSSHKSPLHPSHNLNSPQTHSSIFYHPNSSHLSEEIKRRNSIVSLPDDNSDIVTDLVTHIKANQVAQDVRRSSTVSHDLFQQYQRRNHSLAEGALMGSGQEAHIPSFKDLYTKKINRSYSVDMQSLYSDKAQRLVRATPDMSDDVLKSLPTPAYVPATTQLLPSATSSISGASSIGARRTSLSSSASSPSLASLSQASNTNLATTSSLPAQISSGASSGLQPLPKLPVVIQDLPGKDLKVPSLSSSNAKTVAKPVSPAEKVLAKRKEGMRKLESNLLAPISF